MTKTPSFRLSPAALLLAVACATTAAPVAYAQARCAGPKAVNETLVRAPGQLLINIFYSQTPASDPAAEAKRLVLELAPQMAWFDKLPRDGSKSPKAWATGWRESDAAKVRPPTTDFLNFKGRGLSEEQKVAVSKAREAFFLGFHLPPREFAKHFAIANRIAHELAVRTGGVIMDDDTREVFTPAAWQSSRMQDAADSVPAPRHMTIHAYRDGDYVRTVTLGMVKFGLPELAVQEFAWSEGAAVASLINTLAQRMVEAPLEVRLGRVDVRLADLRPSATRRSLEEGLEAGATGGGAICLYDAKPAPGDADNRLLEIGFDLSQGTDKHARRNALLVAMFGVKPSPVLGARPGDDELVAASRRARSAMPRLKAEFARGLPPNERLLIKAAFRAKGGTEYMWVEVARWEDSGRIRGLLSSEPRYARNLRSGQEVTIVEKDFYDYIRVYADGRREGNETGRILEGRAGAK